MKGFFPSSRLSLPVAGPSLTVPACDKCLLYKGCQSPKMAVSGRGRKRILIVGETPGPEGDAAGEPFVGPSGRLLCKMLRLIGVDPNRDVWKTSALICQPAKPAFDPDLIDHCRPNLLNTIKALNPAVVVLLGGAAVRSLVGHLWKENPGPVNQWAGFAVPAPALGCWVCPAHHPGTLLRLDNPAMDKMFLRHLEAACALRRTPVPPAVEVGTAVTVAYGHGAAGLIDAFTEAGATVAFDYETNMLKPDGLDAKVVCAAVSDGTTTVAYPWSGPAVAATGRLLKSKCPKVAANLKFEDRWTRATFGHGVRGWAWDTMLAAHALDNRPGITGLKFQAFAVLGAASYDDHVKPYLKAKGAGGGAKNRVGEIDPHHLLLYCGADALLEYKLAEAQAGKMGVPFPFHKEV